jgi:antitoxin ParD1/3/4
MMKYKDYTGRVEFDDEDRDLTRRDEDRQARIAHLQRLVDEGLESGVAEMTMADTRNAVLEKFSD